MTEATWEAYKCKAGQGSCCCKYLALEHGIFVCKSRGAIPQTFEDEQIDCPGNIDIMRINKAHSECLDTYRNLTVLQIH